MLPLREDRFPGKVVRETAGTAIETIVGIVWSIGVEQTFRQRVFLLTDAAQDDVPGARG